MQNDGKNDNLRSTGHLSAGFIEEMNHKLLAAKEKLDNLTIFVDYNNIQIDGFSSEVMPLEPIVDKLRSFNLEVMEIDGNNLEQIANAYEMAKLMKEKPSAVVMRTIPGKGVSFMENNYEWHGKVPTKEEGERALKELIENQ